MAESQKILSQDIIEPGLFDNTNKSAQELLKTLKLMEEGFKGVIKESQNVLKTAKFDNAKEIRETTEAIDQNQKATKGLAEVQAEQIKLQIELKAQRDLERKEFKQAVDLKKAQLILDDKEAGLLQKLAANNTILRIQREKLKATDKDYEKTVKEINKAIDANNEKIVELSDNMKKSKLNVGNYASALGDVGGPLRSVSNGFTQLLGSFKALIANPIVLTLSAVVGALYGLYKAFTSTDSGATEMAVRFEQLGAIMDVIKARAASLANAIINVFKGNWSQAADDFNNAVSISAKELSNATAAARKYVETLDLISDAETDYISKAAQNRKRSSELEALAQDQTKTIEERRKALIEVFKIEEEEVKKNKEFAEQKFNTELEYRARVYGVSVESARRLIMADDEYAAKLIANDAKLKSFRDKLNDEKYKDLEELYAQTLDAEIKFNEASKRNISKLSGFEKQIASERKARSDKYQKDLKDARDAETALIRDDYERKKRELQNKFDDDVVAHQGNARYIKAIRQKLAIDLDSLKTEYDNKELEKERKHREEMAKLLKQNIAEEKQLLNAQLTQLEADQINGLEVDKEISDKKIEIAQFELDQVLSDEKSTFEQRAEAQAEFNKTIADLNKKASDDAQKLRDEDLKKEKEKFSQTAAALKSITDEFDKSIERANDSKLNAINEEITAREKAETRQQQLAEQGFDNTLAFEQQKRAQAELERKEALEKAERDKQRAQLIDAYFNAFNARMSQEGADPNRVPAQAFEDVLKAKAGAFAVAQFAAEGNNMIEGPGTTTSDSIPFWLSKKEAVIKASENIKHNDAVRALNAGTFGQLFAPVDQLKEAGRPIAIVDNDRVISLLEDINAKPVQTVDVDGLGNLIETIHLKGMKMVIKRPLKL